jgi:hypothetical protein
VRPGRPEVRQSGLLYEVELLAGSDPTFEKKPVELDRQALSNTLAFWMKGSRVTHRSTKLLELQRPLPADQIKIVASGERNDEAA